VYLGSRDMCTQIYGVGSISNPSVILSLTGGSQLVVLNYGPPTIMEPPHELRPPPLPKASYHYLPPLSRLLSTTYYCSYLLVTSIPHSISHLHPSRHPLSLLISLCYIYPPLTIGSCLLITPAFHLLLGFLPLTSLQDRWPHPVYYCSLSFYPTSSLHSTSPLTFPNVVHTSFATFTFPITFHLSRLFTWAPPISPP
jgi:hypothetical protein